MSPRLLAILLALAPAAHAETFKWLDERGVVNYSNTPPPSATKFAQPIANRVSTYEANFQHETYTPPSAYELMLQQEWLQRQRLMAARQNLQTLYPPTDQFYQHSIYPGYYPVATFVRPVPRPVRKVRTVR